MVQGGGGARALLHPERQGQRRTGPAWTSRSEPAGRRWPASPGSSPTWRPPPRTIAGCSWSSRSWPAGWPTRRGSSGSAAAEWSRLQAKQQEVERLAVEAERAANRAEKAGAAHQTTAGPRRATAAGRGDAGRAGRAGTSGKPPAWRRRRPRWPRRRRRREEARQAHRAAEQAAVLAGQDFEYFRELFNLEMLAGAPGEGAGGRAAAGGGPRLPRGLPDRRGEAGGDRAGLPGRRHRPRRPERRERLGAGRSPGADRGWRWTARRGPWPPARCVEAAVAGSLEIVLPGRVRMTVTGGARTREAEQEVAGAEERLQALYAAAGVSGDDALAQARDLERRRRAAEQTAEQAAKALQDNLPRPDPAGAGGEDRTWRGCAPRATWRSGRSACRCRPTARRPRRPASRRLPTCASAKEAVEQRDRELELAEEALRQVQDVDPWSVSSAPRPPRRRCRRWTKDLAAEREAAGDEQLATALADARRAAEAAGAAHRAAAEELQAQNPEQVEALLENAREVLVGMEQGRRATELELARVKSLLEHQGRGRPARPARRGAERAARAGEGEGAHRPAGRGRRPAVPDAGQAPGRGQAVLRRPVPSSSWRASAGSCFDGDLSIEVDHEDLRRREPDAGRGDRPLRVAVHGGQGAAEPHRPPRLRGAGEPPRSRPTPGSR